MRTIKYISIAIFMIATLNLNAQFKINGSGKTETEMWAHGNHISRYWAVNYLSSYSFGIDASAIGNIWSNINATNPVRLLSFSDSWISNRNYQYTSFGTGRYNRFHYSATGSYGGANGFDFNTYRTSSGLIIENARGEGSGMYFDDDYAVLWSPGDCYDCNVGNGRILRIYDEDGMIEKAYIDGNGYYHTNSDKKCKENIIDVTDALDKVKKIKGVSYNHSYNNYYEPPSDTKETINGNKIARDDKFEQKNDKTDYKYFGFIAQELEEVIPEVVSEDEYGNKFVNYDAVIPILVEAIKDLDNELESIKNSNNKQNKSNLKSATVNTLSTDIDNMLDREAILYQNTPNPFRENTEIRYFLPNDCSSASIYIYNMQGNQIKQIPVYNLGNSSITLNGYDLNAGMYFYSLIADGQEIDTKRMILTD